MRLLNGQSAAGGLANELEVAQGGNLFADNALGQWYQWNGSNWSTSGNPNSTTITAANQSTALNVPSTDSFGSIVTASDQATLPSDLLWPGANSGVGKLGSDHTFTFNDVSDVKSSSDLNVSVSAGSYMMNDVAQSFGSIAAGGLPGSTFSNDRTSMIFDVNKIVLHSPV